MASTWSPPLRRLASAIFLAMASASIAFSGFTFATYASRYSPWASSLGAPSRPAARKPKAQRALLANINPPSCKSETWDGPETGTYGAAETTPEQNHRQEVAEVRSLRDAFRLVPEGK